jgi:hypothetical protein
MRGKGKGGKPSAHGNGGTKRALMGEGVSTEQGDKKGRGGKKNVHGKGGKYTAGYARGAIHSQVRARREGKKSLQ